MNGSQYHLNNYQINFQTSSGTPKTDSHTIHENLERLSYLMLQKPSTCLKDSKLHSQKPSQAQVEPIKKVVVNLRGYYKDKSAVPQKQAMPVQSQQNQLRPTIYIQSQSASAGQTPCTQTPQTPQDFNKTFRKPLQRPQSLAFIDKNQVIQETSQCTTHLQTDRLIDTNHDASDYTKQQKRTYNSWIGLSVIERNQIFLDRKNQKLNQMREQKEQDEVSGCTFAPQFFHQIKGQRQASCMVNKSYQDIHNIKKDYNNDRIY